MKNRRIQKKTARRIAVGRNKHFEPGRTIYSSYNFAEIEDADNAFWVIANIAGNAGKNAAAEAKAAGLPRTYIRNYAKLVQVTPAGEEIVIKPRLIKSSFYFTYKPATILHAVKK